MVRPLKIVTANGQKDFHWLAKWAKNRGKCIGCSQYIVGERMYNVLVGRRRGKYRVFCYNRVGPCALPVGPGHQGVTPYHSG